MIEPVELIQPLLQFALEKQQKLHRVLTRLVQQQDCIREIRQNPNLTTPQRKIYRYLNSILTHQFVILVEELHINDFFIGNLEYLSIS